MLNLYTEGSIPKQLINVEVPWYSYFFDNSVASDFKEESFRDIINAVEKTDIDYDEQSIISKFVKNDNKKYPVSISDLSEGCKTLLCINNAIINNEVGKYIFNITSCGGNAVAYLATVMAEHNDINAYCEHTSFGKSDKKAFIKIENVELSKLMDAKAEYKKLLERSQL